MKTIESTKNERVKAWKKLHTKKGREQTGSFLIEGDHLVDEALAASVVIETIITTRKEYVATFSGSIYYVTQAVMAELSMTETPPGIIAVCQKRIMKQPTSLDGVYVLLDGVQDPGNVGTIIRTALALHASGVILGKGTVDLYNDKVIRSTQGALFHLPIYTGDLHQWVEMFKEEAVPVIGTALTNASPINRGQTYPAFALLVGNEGEGVQPSLLAQTTENVYIPINHDSESLNVGIATGILLFSLQG
ncbi:TrmH family RNA methyltransferase [Shouchella lehensis]|uniref:rRNA methyltransferase n=1 Tax=Shouchella lehensis G1 TaxID=1246626 RepID=A0A060LYH9_9BACI|nr:RNA methyltransferase [Shouchella lehensis]AIC95237.1 rRNA methyltransferase [Shouchella lehensis G1]